MLTPDILAKPGTEHAHQVALMCQCALHIHEIPLLSLLHAIPNGGDRNPAVAGRLKAEGVKPGIPDLHWPIARGNYHSLYVELKIPSRQASKNGGCSGIQLDVHSELTLAGNACIVAYGWEHAWRVITGYWNLGQFKHVQS